jgi:molecular chaperone DnaJ
MFFGNIPISNKSKKKTEEKLGAKKGEDVETEVEISLEDAFFGKTKKISLRTVDGNLKTITVKVPAGIRDKERIRLIGQGKMNKNDEKPGDLFIKVKILKNETNVKGY